MKGGTISGNTARQGGGGVGFEAHSTFSKTGGTITGYASDAINGNVVRDVSGTVRSTLSHAVGCSGIYLRVVSKDTTAGPGDNLYYDYDSGKISGAWDY